MEAESIWHCGNAFCRIEKAERIYLQYKEFKLFLEFRNLVKKAKGRKNGTKTCTAAGFNIDIWIIPGCYWPLWVYMG